MVDTVNLTKPLPDSGYLNALEALDNLARAMELERAWSVLDTIIEGPHDWSVRPVAEIFYESDVSVFREIRGCDLRVWCDERTAYSVALVRLRIAAPLTVSVMCHRRERSSA